MKPGQITPRQQLVLDFIRRSVTEKGYPPTMREIASELKIGAKSQSQVVDMLRCLERAGVIACAPKVSRGIRLLDPPARAGETGVRLTVDELEHVLDLASVSAARLERQTESAAHRAYRKLQEARDAV